MRVGVRGVQRQCLLQYADRFFCFTAIKVILSSIGKPDEIVLRLGFAGNQPEQYETQQEGPCYAAVREPAGW